MEKAKKIKQPSCHKAVRVPVMMQLENVECGAVCLSMVLAYYGKWLTSEQLRIDCGVSRDGSNAKNILTAARKYGFEAKAYRLEPEVLKEAGEFPCILHWEFNHFVVLCGFKGNKAVINDPAKGKIIVSMERLDEAFTGICLLFRPTEAFMPSGKRKSMAEFALDRLSGTKAALAFGMLTTLILSLAGIANPTFSRILADRLLSGQNPGWLTPFIATLSIFSAVQILVLIVQAIEQIRITSKLEAVGSTAFLSKVLRLPMDFFSQRMAGDIMKRQSSNADIAINLVNTAAPLLFNSIMMLIYLTVMIKYSPMLTCIGLISVAANALASVVISQKRINILRVSMKDKAKLASMTITGIDLIENIKSSGGENGYFKQWSGCQANLVNGEARFLHINHYLGMIPALVASLADVIILAIGIFLVLHGSFTIGMVIAFQGFLTAFSQPASELIKTGQTIQEMRTDMECIDDVMEYREEKRFAKQEQETAYEKLKGNIEVKNLTFGYSRLSQPIISDISFSVKQGQRIALVGSSGCGKSTIANVISGLYKPWSGEILYDGKRIEEIDKAVFCGSLSVVDQEIVLFEDTIENNIKMWDETIEDFEMIMAARDAGIHDDIMERDGGYSYVICENGKDFSGGQRQRLEIARVLAQDPTIVILDEATSALDAKTEKEVMKAITDRGITCIVIAHRLSAIRNCDEIIVLDKGVIAERGTHEELLRAGGRYKELISND